MADLEGRLQNLKAVLPEEKDAADLLRRMQTVATQSNLEIKGFKPSPTVMKELHAEWPITLQLEGTYHNLAMFFDRVGKFTRIVNITGLDVKAKDKPEPNSTITATCVATTFVLLEKPNIAREAGPARREGGRQVMRPGAAIVIGALVLGGTACDRRRRRPAARRRPGQAATPPAAKPAAPRAPSLHAQAAKPATAQASSPRRLRPNPTRTSRTGVAIRSSAWWAPESTGARVAQKGEGAAGLTVAEVSVRGIMQSRGALIAMIHGADNKTYIVHQGDKLADGTIKTITPQGLIIVQEVSDPLSLVKQREVRKLLRSLEDAKE